MRILFLCDNFPPERNAQASRIYERACYWVKWGHEITVITCAPNFPEGKLFPGYKNKFYQVEYMDGIRIVRIKTFISPNKGFLLRILDYVSYTLPAIFAGMMQSKFDIIVANTPTPFVAISGWVLSKFKRKPFLLEVSDLWPASITGVGAMKQGFAIRFLEKLELFLYRQAKKIAVSTPSFKDNLIHRNISENKIQTVINGVDITRYTPRARNLELATKHNISKDDFVIGYIGTHGLAHALENIIFAAEQLPNFKFVFVGAGATRDQLMELSHLKNLQNVIFVPSQNKEMIPEYWALCDLSLVHLKNSPVFADVLPSKIFEAMGMGKPVVIAAPKGEAVKLIEQEQMGISVAPENPTALAAAIQACYDNKTFLATLARNSLYAATKYTREQQAKIFLNLMEQAFN